MSTTLQRERMERASAPPMRELADQAFSRAAGAPLVRVCAIFCGVTHNLNGAWGGRDDRSRHAAEHPVREVLMDMCADEDQIRRPLPRVKRDEKTRVASRHHHLRGDADAS